jgi:transposase InsO family protein
VQFAQRATRRHQHSTPHHRAFANEPYLDLKDRVDIRNCGSRWVGRQGRLARSLHLPKTTAFSIDRPGHPTNPYALLPEIFNTDQGSQFTAASFIGVLQKHQIRISMDGRGAWRDNVFVERLWKSVKYEEVYLHAYDSVAAAKSGIGKYFTFYNSRRPHTALDRQTPDHVYFDSQPLAAAA